MLYMSQGRFHKPHHVLDFFNALSASAHDDGLSMGAIERWRMLTEFLKGLGAPTHLATLEMVKTDAPMGGYSVDAKLSFIGGPGEDFHGMRNRFAWGCADLGNLFMRVNGNTEKRAPAPSSFLSVRPAQAPAEHAGIRLAWHGLNMQECTHDFPAGDPAYDELAALCAPGKLSFDASMCMAKQLWVHVSTA